MQPKIPASYIPSDKAVLLCMFFVCVVVSSFFFWGGGLFCCCCCFCFVSKLKGEGEVGGRVQVKTTVSIKSWGNRRQKHPGN